MEGKNAVFQRLKPPCVALSQAALTLNGPRGDSEAIVQRMETLKTTLSSIISPPSTLDPKLAEYVFFPISQVLKASQKVPITALELCLQCITILINQGWRNKISAQLATQIVILCTLLAEEKPKGLASAESTDELRSSAYSCLHSLFAAVAPLSDVQLQLTSESNFPQLGQTVSVILDGISNGGSVEVQMSAVHALEALLLNILDEETQSSLLPGVISKLTRVLKPQTKLRRNHKVLINCLDIVGTLFRNTLNDTQLSTLRNDDRVGTISNGKTAAKSIRDEKWLEQAADQVKPALRSVIKLRSHSRNDVQDALGRLCSVILRHCRKTLANCSSIALETLVMISATRSEQEVVTDLEVLVVTDEFVSSLLQTILYDWLQSLTTIMQGSDEQAKLARMEHVNTAYELLMKAGANTATIDHMLASTLRDSVVVTLTIPSVTQRAALPATPIQPVASEVLNVAEGMSVFTSPLVSYRGQEETMQAIERFTKAISSSSTSDNFVADLARSVRLSQGEALLANFWLLLTATQNALQRHDTMDEFLYIEGGTHSMSQENLEELFSFSLSILSRPSDEQPDPRLQALALRTFALRAQTTGRDFRYELVDALYPVLHLLATPNDNLQQDSITTLNIFASACGYGSVKDLIVENVDYLTNAVALKLNAFDVSPQAPQVLLMMVRLAGPSLLPYLEDTVESIFAALEDYHGYPLLVELLFKVLGVIAEEGAKTPQLSISDKDVKSSYPARQERFKPTTITGLSTLLEMRAEENADERSQDTSHVELHPKRPWRGIDELDDKVADDAQENERDTNQVDESDLPPPAPKTYNLLFKITELTQHFLPSASGSLRTSLLSLIRTAVPAIAQHENSFLPLINTLWPEVVSRLDDDEPYIVAAALDVVGVLCEYAGDFMRSRIVQLWPRLLEIHHAVVKEIVESSLPAPSFPASANRQDSSLVVSSQRVKHAVSRMQDAPANYGDTSSRLLWNSLATCMTTIVRFVQLTPDLFDEALVVMEPVLNQEDVLSAFEEENSDAVWLARLQSGRLGELSMPDDTHWRFAAVTS